MLINMTWRPRIPQLTCFPATREFQPTHHHGVFSQRGFCNKRETINCCVAHHAHKPLDRRPVHQKTSVSSACRVETTTWTSKTTITTTTTTMTTTTTTTTKQKKHKHKNKNVWSGLHLKIRKHCSTALFWLPDRTSDRLLLSPNYIQVYFPNHPKIISLCLSLSTLLL